jgi:hypothetical protein
VIWPRSVGAWAAIQRGGTCTVAAVDEPRPAAAPPAGRDAEASLWVAGGLALAQLFNLLRMPGGFTTTAGRDRRRVVGLGAWMNGACAFAIARLGSGSDVPSDADRLLVSCLSVIPLSVVIALWRCQR